MSNQDPKLSSDDKLLDDAIKTLGEHFDNVTLFVSNHKEGYTTSRIRGTGNWHARHGHVREWLIRMDEFSRDEARKENGRNE